MNKKGSMELSVNAIVILVIAIVMLGLILGFVKSKFSGISKNLELEEAAPEKASSGDPLTVSRTMVVLSPGEKTALRLSYFQNGDTQGVNPSMICNPDTGGIVATLPPTPVDTTANTATEFSLRIQAGNVKDLYICTLTVVNDAGSVTKDITVKVT